MQKGKAKLKMHNKTFECMFETDGTNISSIAAVCVELPNFRVDMMMAEEFKAALMGKKSNAVVLEKKVGPPPGAMAGQNGVFVLETTGHKSVPDSELRDQGLTKNDETYFPGLTEFTPPSGNSSE